MPQRLDAALSFLAATELPTARRTRSGAAALPPALAPEALQRGREQAAVVGSEIVSFASLVDSPWRQDVVNSSLLAQLVARRQVSDPARVFDWYEVYFDTLARIGWAVQDKSFAVYVEDSRDFQAHEAILKVAASLLGPAAASMALVHTTLEALRGMDADSPWITLFDRESRSAQAARFQISVVEQTPDGQLSCSLMAFGLQARAELRQVLFFRSHASEAQLRHCAARVGIDTVVLAGVREQLRAKLVGQANDFVRTLPDF